MRGLRGALVASRVRDRFRVCVCLSMEAEMGSMWQNVRYAARTLAKKPVFTALAVLTLALGIGANAAIFSVVYSALLKPLPYKDASRLITIGEGRKQQTGGTQFATNSSYPDLRDWQKMTKSFDGLAAYTGDAFTMTGNGEPRNVFAVAATGNFFDVLGVAPAMGRGFSASDESSDGPHVAMITYGYWASDFGSDPGVIGKTVRLDGKPATIIGVLPKDFAFAPSNGNPLWVPLHPGPDQAARRNLRWLRTIARLAPGVTMEQARAEMNGVTEQLAREYPQTDGSTYIVVGTLKERIVGQIEPILLVLLGAVGFVLLIACANVANLMMTRSVGRKREFAIRAALGASRGRIVAQLLTESALLAVAGAAAGFFLAEWGVTALVAAIPAPILLTLPTLRTSDVNLPVLAFLTVVALGTAVLFGIVPGITASQVRVSDALKEESRGGTGEGQSRVRNVLVLLVGAGLMLQSLRALLKHDPGFDPDRLLIFSVNLPNDAYPSDPNYPNPNLSATQFQHEFLDKLRAMPGVQGAAAVDTIPMGGGGGTIRFIEEGRPVAAGQEDEADIVTVGSSYFSTLKIPLVSGRTFNDGDAWESPKVLVVNQAFAQKYFPNGDAVGKRTKFTFDAREPYRQIVGVVGNVAQDQMDAAPPPVIYFPNDQGPSTYMSFMVRTSGNPAAFVSTAREVLHGMDAALPLINPITLGEFTEQAPAVFVRRYPSYLIGSFATLALLLAMLGLYGLISFAVAQRTREIGIRMALGAQATDVVGLVMRQGMTAVLAGVGVGVVAGLVLTRTMATLLYGVKATDVGTFAVVAALLIGVSAAASYVPARRAMRTDPLEALRHD
jgi:putative ABC transport system permease protein